MTLGMLGITSGRMKETGLIEQILDDICWKAVFSGITSLVSHGAWSWVGLN